MPITIAAIGFGRHFRRSLLPNLIGCENLALAAVAERDRALRAEAAARFPGLTVASDAQAIFDSPVDAVLISTDPAGHVDLTRAALKAGKHVFVEKPLGTDPAAVRELAQLARQTGRVVSVGTMWRHAPAHRVLDRWLAEHDARARMVDIAVTFPAVFSRDGWDLTPVQLALYDMLIHPIDFARHLLGGIGEVDARQLPSSREGEIMMSLRLMNPAGDAMTVINAATGSHAYQVATWVHTSTGDLIEVDTKDRLRLTTSPTWSGTEGSLRDRATLGWEAGQLYRGWGRKGYAEELAAFADQIAHPAAEAAGDELDKAAQSLEAIESCLVSLGQAAPGTRI
ncbi:Gfo/Idh/MocA family oxidoreductase [Streptomyces sp. NPDC048324]|uniref:Gfo/Idh/MocA family protein n=1 Tax=Streptomyces sp. NPDC048324 TaxID=3157205 RepID=UPI0034442166